jgi:hypothetical protein
MDIMFNIILGHCSMASMRNELGTVVKDLEEGRAVFIKKWADPCHQQIPHCDMG